MKLLSINVALPKAVAADGQRVETGFFKQPVNGPAKVGKLNIEGDGQADLSVHGGADKAVYVYSWKNVEYWKTFLKREDLHPGSFGENLTVDELLDTEVCLGDQFEIGTARFLVTQPRFPCFKLGIAMGQPDFVKTFNEGGRNGFYLRVLQEGTISAGDKIWRIANDDPATVTVAEFADIYRTRNATRQRLLRLAELPALPNSWKLWLKEKVKGKLE
ncbi:MAG: MOSC domain-containing protein [Terriglobia bacterium]